MLVKQKINHRLQCKYLLKNKTTKELFVIRNREREHHISYKNYKSRHVKSVKYIITY